MARFHLDSQRAYDVSTMESTLTCFDCIRHHANLRPIEVKSEFEYLTRRTRALLIYQLPCCFLIVQKKVWLNEHYEVDVSSRRIYTSHSVD